jgi:hypothetical protein
VPIDVAGKDYLERTKLARATKRLYTGVYKDAASKLPSPKKVSKDDARQYLQQVAKERTLATTGNYRAALRNLQRYGRHSRSTRPTTQRTCGPSRTQS